MSHDLPPGDDISLARNYKDNCVWISIGDGPRRCISPSEAEEMADGIERILSVKPDPEGMGYETDEIVETLREMADDVKDSGGDDR